MLHNAAIAACGLDAVYVAFPVSAGTAPDLIATAAQWGICNLNVTMPHKQSAWRACDSRSVAADALESVNTICVQEGRLIGHNTDGHGVLGALDAHVDDWSEHQVVVLGAGATSKAAALAIADRGAEVTIAARREDAAMTAALVHDRVNSSTIASLDLSQTTVLVNGTSVGMAGEPPLISVAALPATAIVLDAVYARGDTALIREARGRDLVAVNGLEMLLHQAAASFELFTGIDAPISAMRQVLGSTP